MNNISVDVLLHIALKRIYILIITALVFAVLAFSYCSFIATPEYTAKGSVLVTNGAIISENSNTSSTSSTVNVTDITASLQLANTITDILKTNDIYKALSSSINDKYTYKELINCSSVARRSSDTLFIDVSFKATSQSEAIMLVNSYLKLVPDYILGYVPNSTAAVTTTADSAQKTYPSTVYVTILSGLIGAIISFIIVTIIALSNNTITSEEDLKNNFDVKIIGNIPDFSEANSKYYSKSYNKGSGYGYGK